MSIPGMTKAQALRLAITELERRKQFLAIDANAADIYKFDNPHAQNASRERYRISQAITILTKELYEVKS